MSAPGSSPMAGPWRCQAASMARRKRLPGMPGWASSGHRARHAQLVRQSPIFHLTGLRQASFVRSLMKTPFGFFFIKLYGSAKPKLRQAGLIPADLTGDLANDETNGDHHCPALEACRVSDIAGNRREPPPFPW